jgi:CBS-domain-containing membrane protein
MQTTVFDVVHMFSELGISAVPIVDSHGKVVNLYETVDVIVSHLMPANGNLADSSHRLWSEWAHITTWT